MRVRSGTVCACGAAMALYWSTSRPCTAVHFLRGSIILEFGSAVTNLACLYPRLTPLLPAFLVFTHAIAVACAIHWCHRARNPLLSGIIVVCIVACLCIGRRWSASAVY